MENYYDYFVRDFIAVKNTNIVILFKVLHDDKY